MFYKLKMYTYTLHTTQYCIVRSAVGFFSHTKKKKIRMFLLRLVIVNIIRKICVNFRQEIHESVLQKMRQLNLIYCEIYSIETQPSDC